jgi:hypothetical protein
MATVVASGSWFAIGDEPASRLKSQHTMKRQARQLDPRSSERQNAPGRSPPRTAENAVTAIPLHHSASTYGFGIVAYSW